MTILANSLLEQVGQQLYPLKISLIYQLKQLYQAVNQSPGPLAI